MRLSQKSKRKLFVFAAYPMYDIILINVDVGFECFGLLGSDIIHPRVYSVYGFFTCV